MIQERKRSQYLCVYLDSWFVEHRGEYTWFMYCISMGNQSVMQGLWQGAQATRAPEASKTVLTPRPVITWSVSPQHISLCLSAGKTPFPSYRPIVKSSFFLKKNNKKNTSACSYHRFWQYNKFNYSFYFIIENILFHTQVSPSRSHLDPYDILV